MAFPRSPAQRVVECHLKPEDSGCITIHTGTKQPLGNISAWTSDLLGGKFSPLHPSSCFLSLSHLLSSSFSLVHSPLHSPPPQSPHLHFLSAFLLFFLPSYLSFCPVCNLLLLIPRTLSSFFPSPLSFNKWPKAFAGRWFQKTNIKDQSLDHQIPSEKQASMAATWNHRPGKAETGDPQSNVDKASWIGELWVLPAMGSLFRVMKRHKSQQHVTLWAPTHSGVALQDRLSCLWTILLAVDMWFGKVS